MNNPFMLSEEQYVRRQDIITTYIETAALHRSRMKGLPYEECLEFVKARVGTNKKYPIKSPEFQYAHSPSLGNKELDTTNLFDYVTDVVNNGKLMAPSLTAYNQVDPESVTLMVPFLDEQSTKRNALKKIKFEAKQDKDYDKMDSADAGQNTVKRYMNSVSGSYTVASTTLYNFTGHSTLTSMCRVGTSYANANNERFLGGLRHYPTVDSCIAALYTCIKFSDSALVNQVMTRHELHYPNVEEVMECIERSTKRAFKSTKGMLEIRAVVEKMLPEERAAFVYTSDLHHQYKHNPQFVEWVIKGHIPKERDASIVTREDASRIIKMLDSETFILACYMNGSKIKGLKFSDVEALEEHFELHLDVANAGLTIQKHLAEISDYIAAFLRPNYLPQSIYQIESMVRKSAVYSDTDSTLSTGQEMVRNLSPDNLFSDLGWKVGYIVSNLACQQLPHLHAMMSANMGIVGSDRFKFSMKNEYYIPLILLTGRVKHYAYYSSAQEGNVMDEMDFTLKGVSLRGNNTSKLVKEEFEKYVRMIFDTVIEKGSMPIADILEPVLEVYVKIVEDIRRNGYSYLKSMEIRDASAYKAGENAPNVKAHRMWEEVFAPDYGVAPEMPYDSVSISVEVRNKAKLEIWLDEMANQSLAERMRDFIKREMKGNLTTLRVPEQSIYESGIPEELMSIIDLRKLTTTIMLPFYIVLEGLGIYFLNEKLTRIINDEYIPDTDA